MAQDQFDMLKSRTQDVDARWAVAEIERLEAALAESGRIYRLFYKTMFDLLGQVVPPLPLSMNDDDKRLIRTLARQAEPHTCEPYLYEYPCQYDRCWQIRCRHCNASSAWRYDPEGAWKDWNENVAQQAEQGEEQ